VPVNAPSANVARGPCYPLCFSGQAPLSLQGLGTWCFAVRPPTQPHDVDQSASKQTGYQAGQEAETESMSAVPYASNLHVAIPRLAMRMQWRVWGPVQ
jgi:hypothetical protein